jgi:hypothetical protein
MVSLWCFETVKGKYHSSGGPDRVAAASAGSRGSASPRQGGWAQRFLVAPSHFLAPPTKPSAVGQVFDLLYLYQRAECPKFSRQESAIAPIFVICCERDALRFFLDARMESFLRGHVAAFTAWNGCPRVLLYDNLKRCAARIAAALCSPAAALPSSSTRRSSRSFRGGRRSSARGGGASAESLAIRASRSRSASGADSGCEACEHSFLLSRMPQTTCPPAD